MKSFTKFKAVDGAEFNTKKECIEYEKMIKKVNAIMKPLGRLPKDPHCDFANGMGYIQHNPSDVEVVKSKLLAFGIKYLHIEGECRFDWLGRYAGDSRDTAPLYRAWLRLYCVDKKGREWGQPYYAFNPEKGEQHPYYFKESK